MSFDEAILEFLNYCSIDKGLISNTNISYKTDLELYLKFLTEKGINTLEDIKSSDIESYMVFLQEDNNDTVTTVARKLTSIKNFHTFLEKEGITSKNVGGGIKRPKLRKTVVRSLSVEDVDKLLDITLKSPFDYRNKAMLELIYGTGLRVSELVNLTLNNIDFTNCIIRILGKGNKERIIPLGEYSMYYLNLYMDVRHSLLKKNICDALSIIETARSHNKNVFDVVESAFIK